MAPMRLEVASGSSAQRVRLPGSTSRAEATTLVESGAYSERGVIDCEMFYLVIGAITSYLRENLFRGTFLRNP